MESGPKQAPTQGNLQKYIARDLLDRLETARSTGRMQGERRVVTILFCDVAGSTAAAGNLDPEDWTEIMNEAFEYLITPVYKYEGTLARLMGDAILAFFGAPIAHEDDPERAVLAALDILAGIQDFRKKVLQNYGLPFDVRVGINTGRVVIGEVGSDLRLEYTAMGDAVNLAARMEQTAEPGTIQISPETYRLIAPLFEVQDLGEQEIKGKREPIRTFRVLGRKLEPGRLRGLEGVDSPLIGREAELASLQSEIRNLSRGRGGIISVIGEAGLGKSRLISELHRDPEPGRSLAPDNLYWFEGRALSYQTANPFGIFRDLFFDFLDIPSEWTHAEQRAALTDRISELFPDAHAEVLPYLAIMLNIDDEVRGTEGLPALEPQQVQDSIFLAVQKTIERLAAEKPLVLVFDDLHWVDPTSLRLLQRLLHLTERARLIIIAMFRPRRHEPSWSFHEFVQKEFNHRYTSINLQPLSADFSRNLVANLLLASAFPDQLASLIMEKAEGNPFYIEEVIRSLLDGGLLTRQASSWQTSPKFNELGVPDTLAAVLTTRLDQLEPGAKRVLQTAAVIGREFRYDTLAGVSPNGHDLELALVELIRRDQVREVSRVPYRSYVFRHGLIQETAYSALLRKDRRDLHRRVAEWWEQQDQDRVDTIARHYLAAKLSSQALPYLIEAAERAARGYSVDEAFTLYTQAAEILDQLEDPNLDVRAYKGLGDVLNWMGRHPEAVAAFERMLAAARTLEDDEAEAAAWHGISEAHMQKGDLRDAIESAREEEQVARRSRNLLAESKALWMKAWGLFMLGEMDEALKIAEHVAALSSQLTDQGQVAHSLNLLGAVYSTTGRHSEAAEQFEKALDLFRALDNNRRAMPILSNLGVIAEARGDYNRAMHHYKEALEIAREIGNRNGWIVYLSNLGGVKTKLGQYATAEEDLRKVVELVGTDKSYVVPSNYAYLAEVLIALGNQEEALKLARLSIQLSAEDEAQDDLALAWRAMGVVAADRRTAVTIPGEVGADEREIEARACFERSVEIFKSIGRVEEEARTLWLWADYELKHGDRKAGDRIYQQARDLFKGLGAEQVIHRMTAGRVGPDESQTGTQ